MTPAARSFACVAALCAWLSPCGVGHAQGEPATTRLGIAGGRLTLVAEAMSPAEALRRIAELSRARLSIGASLSAERVSWRLDRMPIDRAVAKIAHPWNTAVVLGRDGGAGEQAVRVIYVFGNAADDALVVEPPRASHGEPPARPGRRSDLTYHEQARIANIVRLGRISTDDSIGELTAALGDDSSAVRIEALHSLGLIGTDEAIRVVAQTAIGGDDSQLRAEAEGVLAASRGELARTLLRGLRGQNGQPVDNPR
ncbi:MAG: HEAT repeat domain-containing protein [Rhodocyclaceae bacterium]|nr:HEAT repeat domain-containing protein [Rhodocyclaceae bacterium]